MCYNNKGCAAFAFLFLMQRQYNGATFHAWAMKGSPACGKNLRKYWRFIYWRCVSPALLYKCSLGTLNTWGQCKAGESAKLGTLHMWDSANVGTVHTWGRCSYLTSDFKTYCFKTDCSITWVFQNGHFQNGLGCKTCKFVMRNLRYVLVSKRNLVRFRTVYFQNVLWYETCHLENNTNSSSKRSSFKTKYVSKRIHKRFVWKPKIFKKLFRDSNSVPQGGSQARYQLSHLGRC